MKKSLLTALVAFTLVFPALAEDVTINTDTTYDPATHAGKNLLITGDSTLTFNDTATKATSAITLTLGDPATSGDSGNLKFNMTTTHSSVTHGEDYSLAGAGGKVTIQGHGNLTLTGGSDLAMISGENGAVKISLDAGSKIDIQAGNFINGGWSSQDWSTNKANLNIGSTGTINMWDGQNICVSALTGTGTITSGHGGIRGYFSVGTGDATSTFDGKFAGTPTLYKTGAGILTLTAASSNTGTTSSYETDPAKVAILKNSLYIAGGTVKLTGDGKPGNGSVQIDAGATLDISNTYTFGNKITGAGTVLYNYSNSTGNIEDGANPANNFSEFSGDLYLNTSLFYVKSNAMSENMTIHLNGGQLRNNGGSYEVKSSVVIDSASGGFRPGWANQSLTISGKISDGNASTLNILADGSNTGENASWVILTNPSNDYTNTVVDHYLKVTATGALGTGTVTVNGGKVLDLTNTAIAASRLKNSGTITSSSTDAPAEITINATSEVPGGTVTGNIKYILQTAQVNIGASSSGRTGGTVFRNDMEFTNCVSYQAGLGTGNITIDNGLIMNNTRGLGLVQPIEITKNNGSLRAGWQVSKGALGVSGVISGDGQLKINHGETNAGAITLAGENTYKGGTIMEGGGTNLIFIASNSPFGSGLVNVNGKATTLAFLTGGNYSRSLFNGSLNTTEGLAVTATTPQMNDTVNTNDPSVWCDTGSTTLPQNVTFGYVTTLTAEADTTLEFGKCLNEGGQIAITNLTTGETTPLLVGETASETYAFQRGNDYKIDVRVGHGAGTVGVKGNGLNDDPANKIGLGVRSATNAGGYSALTILDDGTFALSGSGLKATARDCAVPNDLQIGSQTVKIQNTGIGNVTLSGKVTGSGTLAISNTSELSSDLNGLVIFNGSPNSAADKFNVTVAADSSLAGNGTIGGNLTLDAGSCLVMNDELGALTVTGSVTASGATVNVERTDTESDLQLVANSIDVTGATVNFAYNGETESLDTLTNVLVFSAKTLTGTDSVTFNFCSETGARLAGYEFKDGQLIVQLGNTNSLPEPSTWVLLTLALGLAWKIRRK